MRARTRCRDCNHVTDEPSFSPGPDYVEPGTDEKIRFLEARYLCPACLSSNIEPDPQRR